MLRPISQAFNTTRICSRKEYLNPAASAALSRIRKTALEWKRPQISESRSRRNCEGRNLRIRLTILEYIKRIIAANPPPPRTRETGLAGIYLARRQRNNAPPTAKSNRHEIPTNHSNRPE